MLALLPTLVPVALMVVGGYYATRSARPERQARKVACAKWDDPSVVECACGAVSPVGRVMDQGVEHGFDHSHPCAAYLDLINDDAYVEPAPARIVNVVSA